MGPRLTFVSVRYTPRVKYIHSPGQPARRAVTNKKPSHENAAKTNGGGIPNQGQSPSHRQVSNESVLLMLREAELPHKTKSFIQIRGGDSCNVHPEQVKSFEMLTCVVILKLVWKSESSKRSRDAKEYVLTRDQNIPLGIPARNSQPLTHHNEDRRLRREPTARTNTSIYMMPVSPSEQDLHVNM